MKNESVKSTLFNFLLSFRIYFIFFISSLCISFSAIAQIAPDWVWAHSASGISDEFAVSNVVDSAGNNYVTGYFHGPNVTFDTITLNNTTANNDDGFLTKYDKNGNVLWAVSFGGNFKDRPSAIAAGPEGTLYITGIYETSSFGYPDLFIAKFDTAGNALWNRQAGGTFIDDVTGITVNSSGNFYLSGYFYYDITFDNISLVNSGLYSDAFIAKYDSSGHAIWAKSAGTDGYEFTSDITSDASGNVYMIGYFETDSITFDTITLLNTSSTSSDLFIVKYDSSGNVLWAKQAGGALEETAAAITADDSGNVYMTGNFSSITLNLGAFQLNITYPGVPDVFVVKYSSSGNVIWATSAGGVLDDYARAIAVDSSGNCYVTGSFKSLIFNYGTNSINNYTSSGGFTDVFVLKCDSAGNPGWLTGAGGNDFDQPGGIAVANNGSIVVSGSFESSNLYVLPFILNNSNITSYDIFIAKLGIYTGVFENLSTLKPVKIYPNPFHDVLTLSGGIEKKLVIIITDISGKELLKQEFDPATNPLQEYTINTSGIVSGFYMIRVESENRTSYTSLIKL